MIGEEVRITEKGVAAYRNDSLLGVVGKIVEEKTVKGHRIATVEMGFPGHSYYQRTYQRRYTFLMSELDSMEGEVA